MCNPMTLRLRIGEPKWEPTGTDAQRHQATARDNRAGQMAYQATASGSRLLIPSHSWGRQASACRERARRYRSRLRAAWWPILTIRSLPPFHPDTAARRAGQGTDAQVRPHPR
jgi:hypothetical protein